MLQKEDLTHKSDQSVLHSHNWLKKLTMILISVLLLTMFGLGGYWVGAMRQQSSSSDFLAKPKPSWVPPVTPAQQSSFASTVIPSQPRSLHSGQLESTVNWKTYTNLEYGISFRYPSDAKITMQKLALLSFEESDGITLKPPYQEPYSKWYILDLVVRDNPQNLDAKIIIDKFIEDIRKSCSPPACGTPKLILDTLKHYENGDIDGYIFHIGAETDSIMVVQTKNNKTYIFRMSGDQGYVTDYGLMLLDQILATFRFNS